MRSNSTPESLKDTNAVARSADILKPLFAAALTLLATSVASAISADGWASQNGGTDGGTGGTTVTVSDATSYISYVESTSTLIIRIDGEIDLDTNDPVKPKPNKTIVGIGTNATIIGTHVLNANTENIIFKNLTLTTVDQDADRDAISIRGAKNIWIDHCTFYDCADGMVDLGLGADYVTISWCKFYYTDDFGHNFVTLVGGNNDDDETDEGRLRVTYHHNWFGAECKGRMPMVRFGKVHIYNNYYNSPDCNMYIGIAWMSEILLENSYFEDGNQSVGKIWYYYESNGKLNESGCIFDGVPQSSGGNDTVFSPPYSYTLDDTEDVKSIVLSGAGPNGDEGGSDTTAPTVWLTAPADEATVSGTVGVTAAAFDNVGVAGVQFKLDGGNLGAEDTVAPYSVSWNTASASAGGHTLTALARDAATNTRLAPVINVSIGAHGIEADDFQLGAADWTPDAGGTWAVHTDGAAKVYRQSDDTAPANRSIFDNSDFANQVVQADVQPISYDGANRFFGVVGRYTDASNYYYLALRSNNTLELKKLVGGSPTPLDSTSFTVVTGNWYTLRLEMVGTALKAYVNGSLELEATDATFASGEAGLLTFFTAADFDNVVVTNLGADTTAPTVTLTSPAEDSSVWGQVTVTADASDSVGVVGVQFKLNGMNLGAEDTVAPYSVSWDSTASAPGPHTLTAVARDVANNSDSSSVTVFGSLLDDFEDGNATGWVPDGGTWSVVTSGSQVYRQSDNTAPANRSALSASNWDDQVVQADVRANSYDGSNRFFGVVARYADDDNYYYFILRSNNTVELKKLVAGMPTNLDSDSFTVSTGTWYTLRLEVEGTSLKAYINDDLKLEATDATLASGKAGLLTFFTAADFDTVVATERDE